MPPASFPRGTLAAIAVAMRFVILALLALSLPAAQQPSSPEASLKAAARREPAAFFPNYRLGEFYAGQGRVADAIPFLEAAHRADPKHLAAAHDLAVAYLDTDLISKARSHVTSLLAVEDRAEWHNLMGDVEEKAGNPQAAALHYRKAAEMEPSEKNLFDWANQFLSHGVYDQALVAFRYAVEQLPRSAKVRVGMGVALYSLRRYDEAVETLCTAVDLDPADTRALFFIGKMQDVSPAMAGAVRERLAGFASRHPKNAAANYYYALSLWQRFGQEATAGQAAQVEALLKRAAALDPGMSAAHLQLGILYEDTARARLAIQSYRAALRIDPNLGQAHYRLARLYRRAGQKELAERHLAAYRKLREASSGSEADVRNRQNK